MRHPVRVLFPHLYFSRRVSTSWNTVPSIYLLFPRDRPIDNIVHPVGAEEESVVRWKGIIKKTMWTIVTRHISRASIFFFWCAFEKKNKISFPFFNRGDDFKLKKKNFVKYFFFRFYKFFFLNKKRFYIHDMHIRRKREREKKYSKEIIFLKYRATTVSFSLVNAWISVTYKYKDIYIYIHMHM